MKATFIAAGAFALSAISHSDDLVLTVDRVWAEPANEYTGTVYAFVLVSLENNGRSVSAANVECTILNEGRPVDTNTTSIMNLGSGDTATDRVRFTNPPEFDSARCRLGTVLR